MSWFGKTIENKFVLFFAMAVVVLVVIMLWNFLSGEKGTYVDHTPMMWTLLGKKKSFKNNNNITRHDINDNKQPFESKGEAECRRIAELVTGKPFPKARPSFMQNVVSGQNLELDCYNDELKIAIEYNGEQHYKYVPHFHSSKDAFYNMKYRDEMKTRLCEQNGIKLVIVPYTVKLNDIENFLREALLEDE
jgi:hypothetical protein